MSTALATMVPSTQRPIPLRVREDLISKCIQYQGENYWVIKDPVGLTYHRLQPEQYCVLQLLDGARSLEQLKDLLHREYPTAILTYQDIQTLVSDLHQKGLVYTERSGQGVSLLKHHREEKRKKLISKFTNLLYLRLPGWDPESTLRLLYPFVRWIFHPWAVAAAALLVVSSWMLLAVQFDEFRSRLPEFQQFFGWPNLMYLWVVLGAAKVIHEFGHGLSCRHFGGECHDMGVLFLVFSPCLYCDVTDSWTISNKWKRFTIGGAGMYIEIVLSAIAIFVWWNTEPGMVHHLCLNLFFVSTVTTVIFNANPLMRFDGYYMLSDVLEIPNLRPKAERMLRESFAWYCLGIESPTDPFMPETGKFWFITYAVSASIYRWFILFGITIFLYTVLKPYGLQSIGIFLAVVSISMIVFNIFKTIYKTISAPRMDPMDYRKVTLTVSFIVLLVTGIMAVPLPLHVEAPFLLEPHEVQHMYNSVRGTLKDIRVEPGESIKKDQKLMVLTNYEFEDKVRDLEVQLKAQEIRIRTYHSLDDVAQEKLAKERMQTISKQLQEFKKQLSQLTVKAPCDGVIIAAAKRSRPKIEKTENRLRNWSGTPLDHRNLEAEIAERAHLLSIAPNSSYQAILFIDQADRNDLRESQVIEMRFAHLPGKTYQGIVESISDRHLEFVPTEVSNKSGGDIPTVTDSEGREKVTSMVYQATILFDKDVNLLKSNIRGKVRVRVDKRSAAQWIWRYLTQTFRFRL